MSFPEFGRVVQEGGGEDFPVFGEAVEPMSRPRSLANAYAKGAVKRGGDIAEMAQGIAPFLPKGPLSKEKAHKFAEEKFPSYDREPEKFAERAGGITTEALLSPGGLAAKAVQIPVGAALGYAAEKLDAPEWVQAIAESAPFFYSGGKKIPLKSSQKKFGGWLRKQGLSENEITPLLKTPEQVERWSKWATKGKKSRELMESIYQKSGHLYDSIEAGAKNLKNPYIDPHKAAPAFLNEMATVLKKLPNKFRDLIAKDAADMLKGGGHFNDFTNFWKDMNAVIGAEHGGKAALGMLKEPLVKALKSIDPKLTEDFLLTNQLYATRAKVASSILTRKAMDEIMDLGEIMQLGAGIANRDMGSIAKVIGVVGARHAAREMLINPKLQNISTRIGEAIKANKYMLAEKLVKEFQNELGKSEEQETSNPL